MELTDEQYLRYSRNILIDEFGPEGQRKILESKIFVIGIGGLGSAVLQYLAAAGVGTIGIADGDAVELTNLQRQTIHFTEDLEKSKVQSAKEKINRINPDIQVNTYPEFVTPDNILGFIKDYDFIIDGTDNFPSKFLVNDACVVSGIPYSHAGVLRFEGQMMTVVPKDSACFRCVFYKAPQPGVIPGSSQAGILGSVAGIFGALQATEAIKYVIGKGVLLTGRMLIYNALEATFREVEVRRRPACPVCGENSKIKNLDNYQQMVSSLR